MENSIKLHNTLFLAEINRSGAELIYFGTNSGANILWSKQTDHWNRVAPNLFPIVGRLVNDSYTFQGKSYNMTQHGFARDREFKVVEQTVDSVRFRLVSDTKSMDIYPYSFVFDVCYSLTETGIVISYETQNTGNELMYYSVGGHPAFFLDEPLKNYYLEFDRAIQLDRHELNGSYFSGRTRDYGFSNRLELTNDLFENDAFVLKQPAFKSVSLKHVNGNTLIQMDCNSWTAIGFWTKKDAPFICIEPWWGWADHSDSSGKLEEKAGIRKLEANEQEIVFYELKCKSG